MTLKTNQVNGLIKIECKRLKRSLIGIIKFLIEKFYRDTNFGVNKITYSKSGEGYAGMLIHKAFNRKQGKNTYGVFNWSEGCQVFKRVKDFDQFMKICKMAAQIHGNHFSYTLIESKDII